MYLQALVIKSLRSVYKRTDSLTDRIWFTSRASPEKPAAQRLFFHTRTGLVWDSQKMPKLGYPGG